MARHVHQPTITPKVFQHFALITVAITVCVAMFADQTNSNRIRQTIAAREAQNAVLRSEADRVGKRHFKVSNLRVRDEGKAILPFAPEEPPTPGHGLGQGTGATGFAAPARGSAGPGQAIPGLPPRQRTPGGSARPQNPNDIQQNGPTAAQLEHLAAASRQRSGAASD